MSKLQRKTEKELRRATRQFKQFHRNTALPWGIDVAKSVILGREIPVLAQEAPLW